MQARAEIQKDCCQMNMNTYCTTVVYCKSTVLRYCKGSVDGFGFWHSERMGEHTEIIEYCTVLTSTISVSLFFHFARRGDDVTNADF